MATLRDEDQVNAGKLRQLREERGWNWAQVARLSSLSVSQVRALETGSTECFYSLQIKNNAARKVAHVLGVAEAEVIIPPALSHGHSTDSVAAADPVSVAVLAQAKDPVRAQSSVNLRSCISAAQASSWMGYGAMSLILIVGLGWYSQQTSNELGGSKQVTTEASAFVSDAALPTTELKDLRPAVNLAPASTAPADANCQFDTNAGVIQAKKPTKSSEQISLMPRQAGLLCVQDGSGKVRRENLKPGTWSTFNGKAPWHIYSEALPNTDVFFQGEKMRPTLASAHHMSLEDKQVEY